MHRDYLLEFGLILLVFLVSGCSDEKRIIFECTDNPDGEPCTWPDERPFSYNGPVYLGQCYNSSCLRIADYDHIMQKKNCTEIKELTTCIRHPRCDAKTQKMEYQEIKGRWVDEILVKCKEKKEEDARCAWKAGPCEMEVKQGYYLDQETQECKYFSGNSGCSDAPFKTIEECQETCVVPSCEASSGEWRLLPDSCGDSCEKQRNPRLGCAESEGFGCDCGPDQCWDGVTCEPN